MSDNPTKNPTRGPFRGGFAAALEILASGRRLSSALLDCLTEDEYRLYDACMRRYPASIHTQELQIEALRIEQARSLPASAQDRQMLTEMEQAFSGRVATLERRLDAWAEQQAMLTRAMRQATRSHGVTRQALRVVTQKYLRVRREILELRKILRTKQRHLRECQKKCNRLMLRSGQKKGETP